MLLLASPTEYKLGETSPMVRKQDKLRVAIAGCHRMLDTLNRGHNWANGFARVPDTAVVGIFDKDQETRDTFRSVWKDTWGEIPGYDDYENMLADTRPDIVCITTRQTMHAAQVDAAVAAGVRGIAIEKPFATSLAEADRIISVCEQNNVAIAYLLDRRWIKRHRAVCELISGGAIGEVSSVVGFGSANLINHGCHWYDMAFALAGDPDPVWASGHVEDVSGDPPDSRRSMDPPGRSTIKLDNGSFIHILPDGFRMGFQVAGSEGGLMALHDFKKAYYWREDEEKQVPIDLPDDQEEWPAGPAAIKDLVNAVENGGKTACDAAEARRATEIGFAIHMSHNSSGAKIQLPAADRSLRIESFPWGNE